MILRAPAEFNVQLAEPIIPLLLPPVIVLLTPQMEKPLSDPECVIVLPPKATVRVDDPKLMVKPNPAILLSPAAEPPKPNNELEHPRPVPPIITL
ncbi:hypothetical protein E24_00095 [Faustovirus]|nr:hypothetical protein E24_00095 [Faustovirus]AMN84013.1 hypothetical protein D5a_00095 [Faustovirus]AMN84998.1 hypothetical protein E23_00095 [Faustovirus]